MATSLAPTTVLPNALQYLWVYDGTGSAVAVRAQADLIKDCKARSLTLKQLLEAATTDEAWAQLSTMLSTSFARRAGVQRQAPLEMTFGTFDGVRGLRIKDRDGAMSNGTVEIRLGK